MIINSTFKPAPWLRNPHLQTIFAGLVRPSPELHTRRERIELPDGDFIDADWVGDESPDAPVVIVFHGLMGSIESRYARGLLKQIAKRGWRGVMMHFRGATGVNRLPRGYHSGETEDPRFFINLLRKREPHTTLAAVGYSLGGNVLLKYMGEEGNRTPLATAVAVSVPFDLTLCARSIDIGFSRIYQRRLVGDMRRTAEEKFRDMPPPFPLPELNRLRNFFDIDNALTAPLHGFRDVHDYYQQSACKQYLNGIGAPTLIIHAQDDPFMSPAVIPNAREISESVTLEISRHGGHVGFVAADRRGRPVYWLEQRIPDYLQKHL